MEKVGMNLTHFEKLNAINVNDKTEVKDNGQVKLTYLSWAWAWQECKKQFPDASYEIEKFENNLPYVYDENTGYMVFTKVTIEGITHEMWLPVMDEKNKAMKNKLYTYKTKYGEKEVAPATMFDINKTIMRCLTKNLAMFGLGIYIYAGEDLPEDVKNELDTLKEQIKKYPNALDVVKEYGKKLSDCKEEELREILNKLEKGDKNNE
jgi:hypothetical protein